MDLYRAMFYCNAESDRDANFIKAESLRIELIAGGLNWKQQEYIMDRLQPNAFFEVRIVKYPGSVHHQAIIGSPAKCHLNYYTQIIWYFVVILGKIVGPDGT